MSGPGGSALLRVEPLDSFTGTHPVPSSKPETQRAVLAGLLAAGESRVVNDLRCDETATMKRACRALGAQITEHPGHLVVRGVGPKAPHDGCVVDAEGSGLVLRTMAAIASAGGAPVILTGNERLRRRVVEPLVTALRDLGAGIEPILADGAVPLVNWGRGLRGGRCVLPGDVSSQFVTAVLFVAPLAERPVELRLTGEVYSQSYIRQTLTTLDRAGIPVEASPGLHRLRVSPGGFAPADVTVSGDWTSASYLLAAAALFPGRTVLTNLRPGSEQGEAAIVPILERIGLRTAFEPRTASLVVDSPAEGIHGDVEIDASDCPNIVPTLAAVGAYLRGRMRVVGARLTRFHKAPRIEAMVAELSRAGVDIEARHVDGVCDGFEVRGRPSYPGGQTFSSWGDHRIFMSLFVAGLRMRSANHFAGFEDVGLSFPDFLPRFAGTGVRMTTVAPADPDAARPRSLAPSRF
jgi:3-phosphoshikimate 1-carboxyvinyltransferase